MSLSHKSKSVPPDIWLKGGCRKKESALWLHSAAVRLFSFWHNFLYPIRNTTSHPRPLPLMEVNLKKWKTIPHTKKIIHWLSYFLILFLNRKLNRLTTWPCFYFSWTVRVKYLSVYGLNLEKWEIGQEVSGKRNSLFPKQASPSEERVWLCGSTTRASGTDVIT